MSNPAGSRSRKRRAPGIAWPWADRGRAETVRDVERVKRESRDAVQLFYRYMRGF